MNDMTRPAAPDLAAVKARQQAAWASGDYAVIGTTLQIVGENLAEAADLRWDEKVLDVRFHAADAEDLPFEDAGFDAAVSTFGVMFTPDHERAARELLRVVRPGGRIALANWTPGSLVGQMFKALGKHVPPPPGMRSPALWGTEEHLRALFGAGARSIHVTERQFNFRYRSAAHMVHVFRTWYGPVHKAFAASDPAKAAALEADLVTLIESRNRVRAGTLLVPSEYLEVVVTRG